MPQRRRLRCSFSASDASFVTRSRSQEPFPSVIFEPREINVAVALFHQDLHQRRAVARSTDAVPARGAVRRAVGRAEQIASFRIEKYPFLPIEFHRNVRTAVQVGVHPALVPNGESWYRFAEIFHFEAHAAARIGKRLRGADHPCSFNHRLSSATLDTQARGWQERKLSSAWAP